MTKKEALKVNLEELRWLLKGYEVRTTSKFKPIEEKKLLESHYVQADETTVVVVASKDEDSKIKKYMWLYKTGEYKNPIILYDYQKTRSSACPKKF